MIKIFHSWSDDGAVFQELVKILKLSPLIQTKKRPLLQNLEKEWVFIHTFIKHTYIYADIIRCRMSLPGDAEKKKAKRQCMDVNRKQGPRKYSCFAKRFLPNKSYISKVLFLDSCSQRAIVNCIHIFLSLWISFNSDNAVTKSIVLLCVKL